MSDRHGLEGQIGWWLGSVIIWVVVALYFLHRANTAATSSSRLANLALCCGLASVPLANSSLWPLGGLGGLIGGGCAIRAIAARRADGGIGLVRPIIGLLLAIVIVLGMLAQVAIPYFMAAAVLEPPDATAWVARPANFDIQLRLPSRRWRQAADLDERTSYWHRAARLAVLDVEQRSDSTFDEAVSALVSEIQQFSRANAVSQPTVNAHGCRQATATMHDKDKGGRPTYVVVCLSWCANRSAGIESNGVLLKVLYEGRVTEQAPLEAHRRASTFIFESIEDGPD